MQCLCLHYAFYAFTMCEVAVLPGDNLCTQGFTLMASLSVDWLWLDHVKFGV